VRCPDSTVGTRTRRPPIGVDHFLRQVTKLLDLSGREVRFDKVVTNIVKCFRFRIYM
jgi:hypothetical protein